MGTIIKSEGVAFFETVNYNQSNRKINVNHLKQIKAEMISEYEKNGLEFTKNFTPVSINVTTNNILDGQHRVQAFTELVKDGKLPKKAQLLVQFMEIDKKDEISKIIGMNCKTKVWSMSDYLGSYINRTDDCSKYYIGLTEFCENVPICNDGNGKLKYRYATCLINGKRMSKELREGTYTYTPQQMELGKKIAWEVKEIKDKIRPNDNNSWIESMILSWYEHRDNFKDTWKELMKELDSSKNVRNAGLFNGKKDFDDFFDMLQTRVANRKTA